MSSTWTFRNVTLKVIVVMLGWNSYSPYQGNVLILDSSNWCGSYPVHHCFLLWAEGFYFLSFSTCMLVFAHRMYIFLVIREILASVHFISSIVCSSHCIQEKGNFLCKTSFSWILPDEHTSWSPHLPCPSHRKSTC